MHHPTPSRRPGILAIATVALVLAACGPAVPTASPPLATSSSPAAAASLATPTAPSPTAPARSPESTIGTPRFTVARSPIRLPAGRSRAVAVVLGSELLVCGGLTLSGTTASILRIDLATGHVSSFGALVQAVHDAGGAVLGGAAYVFGGGQSVAEGTIQRVAGPGTGTRIGELPAARADLVAVSVAGEILIVGGGTTAGPDGRILATTDGIHTRVLGRLLVPVRYPAVAVLGGLVYVVGGAMPTGDTTAIQVVDPASGSVRLLGHLPRPLSHASGLVLDGSILVAGGRSAGSAQAELWRLDPETGDVSTVGRLPYAVSDAAAVVVDGLGELIGGEASGPIATLITVTGS